MKKYLPLLFAALLTAALAVTLVACKKDKPTPDRESESLSESETAVAPTPTEGLSYEAVMGGWIVTRTEGLTATEIIIPAEYEGAPVVGIDEGAFEGYDQITRVVLPDTIEGILSYAFNRCTSLSEINIPDRVTVIRPHAFRGCEGVQTTRDGLVYVDGWVIGCDRDLTEAVIPADVRGIAHEAFINHTRLARVTLPEGDYPIGYRVFQGCTALTEVTVSAGQDGVMPDMFRGCTALSKVTVSEGVEHIYKGSFAACTSLREVKLPANCGCWSVPPLRGAPASGA